MIEVIFLSITQGLTEFLPISSSAHLILVSKYLNFSNENLSLDISLHFGSLLAIIIYFKKDMSNFAENKNLFVKIIISSIPVLVCGYFLIKFNLIEFLRSYKIIGWCTILFGILLYFSDLIKIGSKRIGKEKKRTIVAQTVELNLEKIGRSKDFQCHDSDFTWHGLWIEPNRMLPNKRV